MVFIAESVDPKLSLAPYYKQHVTTLDIHDKTRGLAAFYDPIVTQPSCLEADDKFDIVSSVINKTLVVAGYRNHSNDKRDFIKQLVSKTNFSEVASASRPEQIIICGDFNMPRSEIDPVLNQAGLYRLGGPPHIFNSFSRATFIDHVYTNVASAVTLSFFPSLDDRATCQNRKQSQFLMLRI